MKFLSDESLNSIIVQIFVITYGVPNTGDVLSSPSNDFVMLAHLTQNHFKVTAACTN